jgi:hypothetical protein
MAELSPAAQAVLDAAHRVGRPDRSPHDELDLVAALRAAAVHMEFVQDSVKLHQIATELEGTRQGEQS